MSETSTWLAAHSLRWLLHVLCKCTGFPMQQQHVRHDLFCTVGASFVNSHLFDVDLITGERVRRTGPRQSPVSRHCAGGPPREGTER
jgi:hypothetical protein